jgi:hypothetical protein
VGRRRRTERAGRWPRRCRRPSRGEVGWQYFVLGFTHIVPNGFDHVLFVIGIFLLTSKC